MTSETDEQPVPLLPRRTFGWKKPRGYEAKAVPATRAEADDLFRPSRPSAPARGRLLQRLNELGCVRLRPPGGERVTRGEGHEMLLDALYDEEGLPRRLADSGGLDEAPVQAVREEARGGTPRVDDERAGPP